MTEFPRFDLAGQIALVTGAARGLGRAISLALANAGADVALGFRDASTGGDLVEEIKGMGRRALPLQMDMTRPRRDQRGDRQGASRISAGSTSWSTMPASAPENLAENVTEADFDLTVRVNLKGTFFASQAVGRP